MKYVLIKKVIKAHNYKLLWQYSGENKSETGEDISDVLLKITDSEWTAHLSSSYLP